MINYNSVEEILSAGTTNMTALRNNTKQDDGADSITGVSWFTFNDAVASTIYASGNSYIGFGSASEHLRVNRRDGAMYSLCREEGTLFGYYKFLKIRWEGYSRYNYTTDDYAVKYDVILWDTGDISLHMISIPTSYNTGTYNLVADTTYSYTVSDSNPDVTFKKTDSGFTVENSLISLAVPFEKRFLISDPSNNIVYTVINGALNETPIAILPNSRADFLTYGFAELTLEVVELAKDKQILIWYETTDYGTPTGIAIHGTPLLPQVVSVTLTGGTYVQKAEVVASDDVTFALEVDGVLYTYDSNSWNAIQAISDGMSTATFNSIEEYNQTGMVRGWTAFANFLSKNSTAILHASLPTVDSYFRKIGYSMGSY